LDAARDRAEALLAGLRGVAPDLLVNGESRLGPIVNVSLPGQYGKSLVAMLSLEGVYISHTAACQARRSEVSPVLRAAYPSEPLRAEGATRWSVSERTTSEDVARAVEALGRIVALGAWGR
jgi:cysteine desulfurase